jgi:hypothetical protein
MQETTVRLAESAQGFHTLDLAIIVVCRRLA